MQLYHYYIRSHEGLEGETSAEACEVELKWGISDNLIQNASVQAKTT
jgi:hypothetical protein